MLQYINRPRDFYFEGSCSPWTESMGLLNFMIVKCEKCGKDFYSQPCRIKNGYGKFCSHYCSSKRFQGKNNPNWAGGAIIRKCKACEMTFEIKRDGKHKNMTKCCSRKCAGKLRRAIYVKEKSSQWKGGITPVYIALRMFRKYREWRQQIFTRDDFTCQKCGIQGGYIQAHHKKSFSNIINDIKQKYPLLSIVDIAKNYPDLWDTNNGITLCKSCHRKEHNNDNYK